MTAYNFDDFLRRMSQLDHLDILHTAEQECGAVERSSSRVKGCVDRRKMGSLEYAQQIKEFLYFMRYGQKPSSVHDADFLKYRLVADALVPFPVIVFREFS